MVKGRALNTICGVGTGNRKSRAVMFYTGYLERVEVGLSMTTKCRVNEIVSTHTCGNGRPLGVCVGEEIRRTYRDSFG